MTDLITTVDDLDLELPPTRDELADFVDDPSVPRDPRQPAPPTDNRLRPEDGPPIPQDDPTDQAQPVALRTTQPPAGTAARLLQVARGELGITECNGQHLKYCHETHLPDTEWCAIFVSWCLQKAQVPHRLTATTVTEFARHYAKQHRFVKQPRPGDLVCFDWDRQHGKPFSHIGIVAKVLPNGHLRTYEGNTTNGKGPIGVYLMQRSTTLVCGYCRPHYRSVTPAYTVNPGDTLIDIGTALHVNWKDLAALNNICPPYTIHPGQKLRIPARA
jgi:nucleoid-associated protein YgaU